ncbi:MAG: hypothetical protein INR73_03105 [Williamsia sp.]|nr:hypothetical protein [Williamsia sp.]
MWSLEILSFLAGIILVFISLVGGGFKIKEIEIPRVSAVFRVLSALLGFLFIIVSFGMNTNKGVNAYSAKSDSSVETSIPQKSYCTKCKVWNFLWICNGVQYEALLIYNPTRGFGKMRVKYFTDNKNIIVQEEMSQVSTGQGQYLKGQNPFDTNTFQPITDYIPDNLIMNNETIKVFDSNIVYETNLAKINDVEAMIRAFGFSSEDLDF